MLYTYILYADKPNHTLAKTTHNTLIYIHAQKTHTSWVDKQHHHSQISCHANWMRRYGEYCQEQQREKNENSIAAGWPLSLQAIMQIVTHAAPLSHQHPPVSQLIHPLRIFKKLLQISKPWFFNRSNLCGMIKGREAELVAEDRITASANDQWAQEISLCDLQKQLYSFGFH